SHAKVICQRGTVPGVLGHVRGRGHRFLTGYKEDHSIRSSHPALQLEDTHTTHLIYTTLPGEALTSSVGEMALDNVTVAALGRPFTLGMLYDAQRDELIPGLTLWDDETRHGKVAESPQRTSAFQISASDSTESKCNLLDVEASLKASFLGGLIEKLDASSVQQIKGSMQAVIKKIPSFDIEGKMELKLSDEEKALTQTLSCKFFGDLILESNPATFVEAVKTYVQLPKLLGEKGEKAVPVKVWLMPLKNLDPEAAELKRRISSRLVSKVQDSLEDMREIALRCNNSQEDNVLDHFPVIREELSTFQKTVR
ncbi:hypothetical protein FQN60_011518, partial [Etheostoma spectabile]